jgi:hypothetical protein
VEASRGDLDPTDLPAKTVAALRLVDLLSAPQPTVDTATYQKLREHLDDREILELGAALSVGSGWQRSSRRSASARTAGRRRSLSPGVRARHDWRGSTSGAPVPSRPENTCAAAISRSLNFCTFPLAGVYGESRFKRL